MAHVARGHHQGVRGQERRFDGDRAAPEPLVVEDLGRGRRGRRRHAGAPRDPAAVGDPEGAERVDVVLLVQDPVLPAHVEGRFRMRGRDPHHREVLPAAEPRRPRVEREVVPAGEIADVVARRGEDHVRVVRAHHPLEPLRIERQHGPDLRHRRRVRRRPRYPFRVWRNVILRPERPASARSITCWSPP